ncbi:MAG: isocitrate/isopropylmalate dehydrogenase family protein [Acidobacteria bacterium]|nr:isocitrate/isopropylmalate dehydrogenase family protein [Acidobacteriota bacterium]MBI3657812.1 isocitrate/isopropylmalate dehydrogenase family protein [Acidobacteriota bacterium]
MKRIAVIPGDGIGIDVTREAVKVIETITQVTGTRVELVHFDYGAEKYLREGISLPEGMLETFRREYDAIFLGALGDPRVPDMKHAADILFGLRFGLDLFANVRPIKLLHPKLTPLKNCTEKDLNFTVVRENTEDMYVGIGGFFKKNTDDEVAIQESINTRKGVERVIEFAFKLAEAEGATTLTMSDKSNALRYGHDLWQRVFEIVGKRYPHIKQNHWYIDALSMQMVKKPSQFKVVVTSNVFGDIVTDLGAQLQGGLGLAASANINPNGVCMFEPVHGSAPKYAGKNVANPFGAILTVQLMLEHLGYKTEGRLIENAVRHCIVEDQTTQDLGGPLSTVEAGNAVCHAIRAQA